MAFKCHDAGVLLNHCCNAKVLFHFKPSYSSFGTGILSPALHSLRFLMFIILPERFAYMSTENFSSKYVGIECKRA